MADPLSVAASIAGLLALSGSILSILRSVDSSRTSRPYLISLARSEITNVRTVIQAINKLIAVNQRSDRESFIIVEDFLFTLTDLALTMLELEKLLKGVQGDKNTLLRTARWMARERDVRDLLQRLGNQKATLALMLNILQCNSDHEALQNSAMIASSIDELLRRNTGLRGRMERLETHVMRLGGSTRDSESVRLSLEMDRISFRTLESILGKSRVYRRLAPRSTRFSFDSGRRTAVSSIFANISLSEISNISVLEVPLWTKDVGSAGYFNTSGIAIDKRKASMTSFSMLKTSAHVEPEPVQGIHSPVPEILFSEVDNATGLDQLGSVYPQNVLVAVDIQGSRTALPPPRILITDVGDATWPAPLDSDSPGGKVLGFESAVDVEFTLPSGGLTVLQTNLEPLARVRDNGVFRDWRMPVADPTVTTYHLSGWSPPLETVKERSSFLVAERDG